MLSEHISNYMSPLLIRFPPFGSPNDKPTSMGNEIGADNTPLLDARQTQYLEWLVTPTSERTPRTQAELASQLGVDPTTLRRWQHKPHFKAEWDRKVSEIQGSPERTQRLLDSLYAKALSGDNRAAQLYLQATNRLLPSTTIVNNNVAASELSDEELDKLLASMAEREQTRRLKAV